MWTELAAGKQRNDKVDKDPTANHRGGSLSVYPATLQQELMPWSDGTGDAITLDFILPGELYSVAATPLGWEGGVTGSQWRAGVADLSGSRLAGQIPQGALDTFSFAGSQAYVRIPFSEVPAVGTEWRAVRKQLGGSWRDFDFLLYPRELTAQDIADGFTMDACFAGSISVCHKVKMHDCSCGPKYMTGKAAHLGAPLFVGFAGNGVTITGWCYGWYEVDEVTGIITKVAPADVIRSWPPQTATVVSDATFGYTAEGASANNMQWNVTWPGFPTDAVVDEIVTAISIPDISGFGITNGIYSGAAADSNPLVENSDLYVASTFNPPTTVNAGSAWYWAHFAYAAGGALGGGNANKPQLSAGGTYTLLSEIAAGALVRYDSTGPNASRRFALTRGNAPPDPIGPNTHMRSSGWTQSTYITYSPAAGLPFSRNRFGCPSGYSRGRFGGY